MRGSCPSHKAPNEAVPRRSCIWPCGSTCNPTHMKLAPAGGDTGPRQIFCQALAPLNFSDAMLLSLVLSNQGRSRKYRRRHVAVRMSPGNRQGRTAHRGSRQHPVHTPLPRPIQFDSQATAARWRAITIHPRADIAGKPRPWRRVQPVANQGFLPRATNRSCIERPLTPPDSGFRHWSPHQVE